MRVPRGFTLLEMMVVLAISLIIMMMIVPIFQVTTRTIDAVERKLKVFEAARMILDLHETQVQQATMATERGEIFCLKNYFFKDKDAFTPDNPGKFYALSSRREADCLLYASIGSAGNVYSGGTYLGSIYFPLQYSTHVSWKEGCQIRHAGDMMHKNTGDLSLYTNDVSQIITSFTINGLGNAVPSYEYPPKSGKWYSSPMDVATDYWSPGKHWMEPVDTNARTWSWPGIQDIYCMDLDIAWWDAEKNIWMGAATAVDDDVMAVYFAPMPKALRFTITVCDRGKRNRVTMSRVVQLPCGIGRGSLDPTQITPDVDYCVVNPAKPGMPAIPQYNRRKNLKVLEPHLVGNY